MKQTEQNAFSVAKPRSQHDSLHTNRKAENKHFNCSDKDRTISGNVPSQHMRRSTGQVILVWCHGKHLQLPYLSGITATKLGTNCTAPVLPLVHFNLNDLTQTQRGTTHDRIRANSEDTLCTTNIHQAHVRFTKSLNLHHQINDIKWLR